MIDYQFSRFSAITPSRKRIKTRKGRLNIDVPVESFRTAFSTFSKAAEGFAMTLGDMLHRKFAYSYLTYLQEFAIDAEQVKPNLVMGRPAYKLRGRPAYRLIGNELERLFRCYFFRPDEVIKSFGRASPARA